MAGLRVLLPAVLVCTVAFLYQAWSRQCPHLERVKDYVVLITGASSGIGAELAVQYGRLGAAVAIAARRGPQLQQTAAAAIEAGARDVLSVVTDMASKDDVEALIGATVQRFGRIDVLVLNHASVDDTMFVEHNDTASVQTALQTVVASNLFGSAMATYAALPYLEKTGGHVAVVSSASAHIPAPFHSAYVASKRALQGYFDTVRHELHLIGSNVTIGTQVLGMIGTPEIMKDSGNARLAIPVAECASLMICAVQARWKQVFVPQWYSPITFIMSLLGTDVGEWAVNNAYVFNSETYVARIQAASVKH